MQNLKVHIRNRIKNTFNILKKANLNFLKLYSDRILAIQAIQQKTIAINSIIYIIYIVYNYTITIHSYITFLVSVSESLFLLFFIILQKKSNNFSLYINGKIFISTMECLYKFPYLKN